MKIKSILFIVALFLLVGMCNAATVYAEQGMGETDKGIDGVLVPIGIPVTHFYLYTWISLGFLALIAASASQRNGEFWAILLPIFASMFVFFGWLVMPIAQGIGIIIMCGVLAVAVYMKGKQQEKFGIAGPGGTFLNIVFWMVIIQASISFINAVGLFGGAPTSSAVPAQYQNVDLISTVPAAASTGGWFNGLTQDAFLLGTGGIAAFIMAWKVFIGIVYFKGLVLGIAPFLSESAAVILLLNVFTVAIDFAIILAVWLWLFKPPATEVPT